MVSFPPAIAALNATCDRSAFDSGSASLDRYLREQATQDIRRRMAACFVALDEDFRIMGYYTLATASIPLDQLPPDLK
ncbi:MAG: GNAT family N-acetyltransferase, partial [Zoogloeaceae bacterium]|nr:GNAT family N-acetyltransferase [Zoogloeaceae bacterium]